MQLTDALKRAYDDLRQSQLTLAQQERLRALGQMASGIAHDINNAVSPISLYVASLLEREPGLTPQGRRYLSTIQRAIEDVTQTVQRMREFYRRPNSQAVTTSLDLNVMVDEVIELTRVRWENDAQASGAFIDVRREFSSGGTFVNGTPGEIRDALVNLVFNAIDAMPNGGVLTLRTNAFGTPAAPMVQVEVGDTGIGMDVETKTRALEPFFTTKGERGTGMGLPMVYGMAQRHGAALEILSAPNEGTKVRLTFRATTPPIVERNAAVPPSSAQPLNLLIIDDDPLLITSLRDVLEAEGHTVLVAGGGQSGVDTFVAANARGDPIDAVITDLGMPQLDGRAVAAAIKAIAPATTVILLTGWGARLIEDEEVPEYVDHVLSKPPKLDELRRALTAVTPVRK